MDALCIDQSNIPERNSQVSIMKQIYSQASLTFVYFGESCLRDGEVLKLMISLVQLAQNVEKFSLAEQENMKPLDEATSRARDAAIRFIELKNAGFPGAITRTTDLLSAGLPHPQDPAWDAMKSLFERPWFSRMWIIQEVVLGPDALVMLGGYRVSWKLVIESGRAYLKLDLVGVTRYRDMTISKDLEKSAATCMGIVTLKDRSLINLLYSFRHCYSSDPRDKVYALLGLANDQGTHQMASVDYSKSVEAVYLECAQFLVRNGNGMVMLALAGISQRREETDLKLSLPSWVPDWSGGGPNYSGTWGYHYRAAGETQIDIGLEDGGNGLNAKGIRIDVVDALAPLLRVGAPKPDDMISWEHKVRGVAQQSRFFSEERVDSYAKALGQGLRYRVDDNNGYTSIDFDPFSDEIVTSNVKYLKRILLAAPNYKFCVTRMGYMGWVPVSSQPGDFIIVLYGCPMLFTVREINGKYVLQGISYLEGFMNGEALKLGDAGPEEFVLV